MKKQINTQRPIRNKQVTVREVISILISVLICFSLIGCSSLGDGEVIDELQNGDFADGLEEIKDRVEDDYDDFPAPVWESKADSFSLPCYLMSVENAVRNYAITLVGNGKYSDYEGDVGDIIPEYKDRDLDGDGGPDVIRREGKHYVIDFSSKGTLKTGDYSAAPNEGEVFEFEDRNQRNTDDILIAHYTLKADGPHASDSAVYSYHNGSWRINPLIDKEGAISSKELRECISKEMRRPYDADSVRIAGVRYEELLIDFGADYSAIKGLNYKIAYIPTGCSYDKPDNYTRKVSMGRDLIMYHFWPVDTAGEHLNPSDFDYMLWDRKEEYVLEKIEEIARDYNPEEEHYKVDGEPYDYIEGILTAQPYAEKYFLPAHQKSVAETVQQYAVTLVNNGKYAEYEGDIGDVIHEYKNRDIDGDNKPDVIKRESSHYVIEFSDKGTLKTKDYSELDNEGVVFRFNGLGMSYRNEISIAYYDITREYRKLRDADIYSYQDGEWKSYSVASDGRINMDNLYIEIGREIWFKDRVREDNRRHCP